MEEDKTSPAPEQTENASPAPEQATQEDTAPPTRRRRRKKRRRAKLGVGAIIVRVLVTLLVLALLFCLAADILYNLGYISPKSGVGRAVVRAENAIMGAATPALEGWQSFWAEKGSPALDKTVGWFSGLFQK